MSRRRKRTSSRPLLAAPDLPEVLARLDAWLYRNRRRMRRGLRPGSAVGARFVPDLATLLAWHDGQAEDFTGTFADGWCLLSAAEITVLAADLDADPPPGWVRGWLPFARTANDSFLVLDPHTEGHPVRAVWYGKAEVALLAPSLTAWFTRLLSDFEAGRYAEDSERGDFQRRGATETEEKC